jgi:hypothetical protein
MEAKSLVANGASTAVDAVAPPSSSTVPVVSGESNVGLALAPPLSTNNEGVGKDGNTKDTPLSADFIAGTLFERWKLVIVLRLHPYLSLLTPPSSTN